MEKSVLFQYGSRSYYYIKNMGRSPCLCTNSGAGGITGKRKSDVIIVGAGVAGSALAHALGKDGRKVHVIERNLREPKGIVGEILQPAGYLKLRELGLDDCVREIDAQLVDGYVLYKDGKSVRIPYPLERYDNDVAGRSLHHGRFVQRMRQKAASVPNVELVQGTATALIEDRGSIKGVKYKTRGGQELTAYAPLTVVCDGCFSTFRGLLSKSKIDKRSHFAGFVMENCRVPHQNYAHIVIGSSCFVLYSISSTEVRFVIDIPGPKIPSIANGEMAQFLKTVVAPQVPPELYSAFISSVENTRITVMPTSVMPAAPRRTPGALLLGDALNMRHAITGGGMTVALHDVAIVCNLFRHVDLDDMRMVAKYTQKFYNIRKPMAFTMNVVANALYNMIISPDPDEIRREMQQAWFDYMSLENDFSRGLMGLISGLNPRPLLLGLHVFVMAIYVLGSKLLPVPSPRRVFEAVRLATGAAAIVVPIVLKEGLSKVFFT